MEYLNIDERRPHNCDANLPILLRSMLDLLVHSDQCWSSRCQLHNCDRAKRLHNHVIRCERGKGHCRFCDKTWRLLRVHTRACRESNCDVPCCRGLEETHSEIRRIWRRYREILWNASEGVISSSNGAEGPMISSMNTSLEAFGCSSQAHNERTCRKSLVDPIVYYQFSSCTIVNKLYWASSV